MHYAHKQKHTQPDTHMRTHTNTHTHNHTGSTGSFVSQRHYSNEVKISILIKVHIPYIFPIMMCMQWVGHTCMG